MFCFHKWRVLSGLPVKHYQNETDTRPVKIYTDVLYECIKCSKVKSERIKGHWSFDTTGNKEANKDV